MLKTSIILKAASSISTRAADRLFWLRASHSRRVVQITDGSKPFQWLAYDRKQKALTAHFASGARYRYDEVPPRVARELFLAKSRGKYFNTWVRGDYATWKLA